MIAHHTSQNEVSWNNYSEYSRNVDEVEDLDGCISWPNIDGTIALKTDDIGHLSLYDKIAAAFLNKRQEKDCKEVNCDGAINLEEIVVNDDTWKTVVFESGAPRPMEWQKCAIRLACSPALHFKEEEVEKKTKQESSDEDDTELRKLMDMHLLALYFAGDFSNNEKTRRLPLASIDYCANPIQTADEVIEEIEEILMNADKQDAAFDDELEQQTGIVICDGLVTEGGVEVSDIGTCCNIISTFSQNDSEKTKALKCMSFVELNEELSNLESTVKYLSESLLKELNLRDEVLYEKEVRTTFISKILEVQCKQEQFEQNNKACNSRFKFGRLTKSLSMSNASVSSTPGRFLTTVIPFDDGGIPSMEGLQALIKLLDAIKEDRSDVPSLITEYILKVLCPAPSANGTLSL